MSTPNIGFNQNDPENINRAEETRRDNDIIRTPSITLYDVDYALLYYLKEAINPQIEQNGAMMSVPIIYGGGEVWDQIKSKGYMRDKQGKLLVPYIVIRRGSLTEDDRFIKVEVNEEPVEIKLKLIPGKDVSGAKREFENIRDQHRQLQNSKPSYEYLISVIPEYYIAEYELIIYTLYTEQLNLVLQSIITENKHMWGDYYKFYTIVGDFSFETINPAGSDRIVKATTNLTVYAKLQSEFEMRKSTLERRFSTKRIVFKTERSSFDIHTVDQFPD